MSKKYFSWSTGFKSIIVVDNELFNNDYTIKLHINPITSDLKEQADYFERLKMLFENVLNNTIIAHREEKLYQLLEKETNNRFIQLPRQPYDQLMAAVCFTKSNAVLQGKIIINDTWHGGSILKVIKNKKNRGEPDLGELINVE